MTIAPSLSAPRSELADWLDAPTSHRQHPADELMAEHQLNAPVLDALEIEASRLARGGSLVAEFWDDAVDFIGNFVHLCHRHKEEFAMFSALERLGWMDRDVFHREHDTAGKETLELCDAVSTGDWESTMRLAALYAATMRAHMGRETYVLLQAKRLFTPDVIAAVQDAFGRIESSALGARGRKHYADVARRLASHAGLELAAYGL